MIKLSFKITLSSQNFFFFFCICARVRNWREVEIWFQNLSH